MAEAASQERQPCTAHSEAVFVRRHCSAADCRASDRCHVAVYCRRCERQWIERCREHQEIA